MQLTNAEKLLEAVDDALAKMTLRAYRTYYIALETLIARYQDELQRMVQSYLPKILASYGHQVTLKVVLVDLGASLNQIGERYLQRAANMGFERCLVDLSLAGKIDGYQEPAVAPTKLSAQAIEENRGYIEQSLLPDMLTKMTDAPSLTDALASFEHRISMYGHYLWRTSERSYILGMQMFEAARKEARKRSMREAGNANSGDRGHAGIPGHRGGSAPSVATLPGHDESFTGKLYHATSDANAQEILKNGFDATRARGGAFGVLGKGVYFAPSTAGIKQYGTSILEVDVHDLRLRAVPAEEFNSYTVSSTQYEAALNEAAKHYDGIRFVGTSRINGLTDTYLLFHDVGDKTLTEASRQPWWKKIRSIKVLP